MSTRPVRPRLHVHRGTAVAAALWFDPSLLGEAEARRRVLSAWAPGTAVFLLAGGFLLRLPRPRPVLCAAAPGLPLTLVEGVLLAAPLSSAEWAQLRPPVGSAVLVRAGHAEAFPAEPSRRIDVAAWLEVSGWSTVSVQGLGAPPPPVKVLEPVAVPARSLFKGVPQADPEAEAMRARMEGKPVPQALQARVAAKQAPALRRFMSWLQRSLAARKLAAARKPALPAGSSSSSKALARPTEPAAPSWLSRLMGRLRSALDPKAAASAGRSPPPPPAKPAPPPAPGLMSRLSEWLLRNTPLGPLLGQRKAEYVQRLFDMFEQGNLDEALRYAIPLGEEKLSEPARVALGLPGPRESLAIRPQRGAGAIFGGGQEVFAALKERYRAAFKRLEREGRIDEAAFVLTELLGAHEEAVSFLEKHGRLRLAAELAEGRGLAPGLVVRQWMVAKDIARAVAVARRTGAFADALPRLDRTHPKQARVLRLLWAETQAEAGNYLRAVDVVWPLEDARPLARAWLEEGVKVGGVRGAEALSRLLSAFPEECEAVTPMALALLEDESQARAAERFVFTKTLALKPHIVLGGVAIRSLLRDRAAGYLRVDMPTLTQLMREMGDGTLRADLPAMPPLHRRNWSEEPSSVLPLEKLATSEAGPYPIHDAVALSSHRLLLALGEAGVRLVRLDGTCVAHFDVPAFSLVPALNESRVLALAPRGELKRLSVIELGPRRASHWCDAKVDAWSPTYDGNLWFISEKDTVMMVDALAQDGLRALWRVAHVDGEVMALEADHQWLRFATWGSEPQLWTYALADGPVLRSRAARRPGDGLPMVRLNETAGRPECLDDVGSSSLWVLTHLHGEAGSEVKLALKGGPPRAHFLFEGGTRVRFRFSGGGLLLFDTSGRLVRVDLTEGVTRRVWVQ